MTSWNPPVIEGAGVEPHIHRQRHFAVESLRIAIGDAGLELVALLGQREKDGTVLLQEGADEERDEKALFIAGLTQ